MGVIECRGLQVMAKGIMGPNIEDLPSRLEGKTNGEKAISDAGMLCD